jgi:sirohydrochlorin cobaltochelatase
MSRALVIVGHGSERNPYTCAPICQAIAAIRKHTIFDEVYGAFWKGQPHLSNILDRVKADDITVVPFFISNGYYTEQVIPREMQLDGPVTHRDGKVIYYTEPVGAHPLFAQLVVERARAVGAQGDESLIVLGHGTPKNPRSAENVYRQAERVAAMNQFPEVVTLFIDQDPNLSELFERTTNKRIVIVPLFVADGWHVSETIPEDLAELQHQHGREVMYAQAVGTDPRVAELILGLCIR